MNTFSIEEFVAQRRTAQDKYTALLLGNVTEALQTRDFDKVVAQATKIFTESYHSDTTEPLNKTALNNFISDIDAALDQSTKDSDPTTTALMLSLAALNSSAIAAADADPEPLELEWVGMEDSKERPTHVAANGQTQAPGNEFTVGDTKMPYPGFTRAPIEEWINCRCVLRPTRPLEHRATSALVAALRSMESEGSIEISEELFTDAVQRGMAVEVGLRDDGAILYDLNPEFRDVSTDERKKRAKDGTALPDGSFPIANCSDLANAIQAIGRAKDPAKAKAHIKKRKNALGCPDVQLPDTWALEDLHTALDEPLTDEQSDDLLEVHLSLVADSSGDHSADKSVVVVALPAADDPVHGMGDEPKHVTLAYMGDFAGNLEDVHDIAKTVLAPGAPFEAAVSGQGQLGPDKAKVLFVEAPELAGMRAALEGSEVTGPAMASGDAHPHFVPHMTMDYAEMPEGADAVGSVKFDRVAVWHGADQTEFALGQPLEADPTIKPTTDDTPPAAVAAAPLPDDANGIPVHGVLAPEGVPSGDGRGFRPGSLTNRPLPLPGTYQSKTAEAHDNADLVFMIEKVQVIDGLQHWSGHMRTTPEADAALGVLVDFGGRFGLSVDADSAVGEFDEGDEVTWFSEARSSAAAMVNIPAFTEAYIAIGPHPILDAEHDAELETDVLPDPEDDAPALVAAGAFLDAVKQFKDLAPGVTEDGPGWLTHPVDTDRLRDYWVHGEGAVKIGWGVPGDFNRCRVNLAQYVKPEFLNGYCANRHYDALHVWPGQEAASQATVEAAEGAATAPSISLTASAGWAAPSSWFEEPEECKRGDKIGVVITPEGRTFGFLAMWGECHIGLPGVCTAPPESPSNYAYFKTGLVPTAEGGFVEVGQLTIGGGHADQRLGYRGAVAHYDSTSSVWADVNVGENEHGIWFAGPVRPGISEDMIYAARASGRLSGDWRDIHGDLELTGALSVNIPGFPIPKVSFAAQGGRQTALVAAGVVPLTLESNSSGPGAEGILTDDALEAFATKLFAMFEERETIKTLTTTLELED